MLAVSTASGFNVRENKKASEDPFIDCGSKNGRGKCDRSRPVSRIWLLNCIWVSGRMVTQYLLVRSRSQDSVLSSLTLRLFFPTTITDGTSIR